MNTQQNYPQAPALQTSEWLNTDKALTLQSLRGKIVVLLTFQMLCPGCVSHGLPQAMAIHRQFGDEVQVIGLHTVFEHHEVMTADALRAFVSEYRIPFPIAIDQASGTGTVPKTMAEYRLQGTPSMVIIDREGCIRLHHFGRLEDMQVGSIIGALLAENTASSAMDGRATADVTDQGGTCNEQGCRL